MLIVHLLCLKAQQFYWSFYLTVNAGVLIFCPLYYFHNITWNWLCICISCCPWGHPIPGGSQTSNCWGQKEDCCLWDKTSVWETNPGRKTSTHTHTYQWWLVCSTRCWPQGDRYFFACFVLLNCRCAAHTWSLFLHSMKRLLTSG